MKNKTIFDWLDREAEKASKQFDAVAKKEDTLANIQKLAELNGRMEALGDVMGKLLKAS